LPSINKDFPDENGIYHWNKKAQNGEGTLNVYLEPDMHEERFKVILFYNHEKYESEPVIFINVDDMTSIYEDKTSALSIEHMEDSSVTYQSSYGANNFLRNRAESQIKRGVKAVYNGVLGTTEEVLVDTNNPAYIYWYIPRENTMISVDYENMIKAESEGGAGFTTDYVPSYRFKDGVLKRLWKWYEWLKKNKPNKKL